MSTHGLGYRQRAVLDALQTVGHPLQTGRVVDVLFPDGARDWSARKTTSVALNGLRERGLVMRVRHGWWRAT